MNKFAEVLKTFRPATRRVVDRTVLAAEIPIDPSLFEEAHDAALKWANARCQGAIPASAWAGRDFDISRVTRVVGACMDESGHRVRALRIEDPDRTVTRRVWTTDVVLAESGGRSVMGVSQRVSAYEDDLEFLPGVPGLVADIAGRFGAAGDGIPFGGAPFVIGDSADMSRLIFSLLDRSRKIPVVVVTGMEGAPPLMDPAPLARALCGIAHVVVLPAEFTYEISDAFGRDHSVWFGAMRVYMPGRITDTATRDHALTFPHHFDTPGKMRTVRERLIRRVAQMSAGALAGDARFDLLQARILELKAASLVRSHPGDAELSAFMEEVVADLERRLETSRAMSDAMTRMAEEAEARALEAERRLAAAHARIRHLETADTPSGDNVPRTWEGLAEWIDTDLSGLFVMTPMFRRNMKTSLYRDTDAFIEVLDWFRETYIPARMGGGGSLVDVPVASGMRNSHCGGDAFRFDHGTVRLDCNFHIKNNGNTRDPQRCFRLYYAWDPATERVILVDGPQHRHSALT